MSTILPQTQQQQLALDDIEQINDSQDFMIYLRNLNISFRRQWLESICNWIKDEISKTIEIPVDIHNDYSSVLVWITSIIPAFTFVINEHLFRGRELQREQQNAIQIMGQNVPIRITHMRAYKNIVNLFLHKIQPEYLIL